MAEHNGIASYALPASPPKYLLVSGLVFLYSLQLLIGILHAAVVSS